MARQKSWMGLQPVSVALRPTRRTKAVDAPLTAARRRGD